MEPWLHYTAPDEALTLVHHPSKVVVAICRDREGRANAITLEWFMRTSIRPLMFAISVAQTRYSYECLQNHRFFNLVFPSPELKAWTELCGTHSGRDLDKMQGIETLPGKLAALPIPKLAAAAFECSIVTQVKSGDHTIFVGQVEHAWMRPEAKILLAESLYQ